MLQTRSAGVFQEGPSSQQPHILWLSLILTLGCHLAALSWHWKVPCGHHPHQVGRKIWAVFVPGRDTALGALPAGSGWKLLTPEPRGWMWDQQFSSPAHAPKCWKLWVGISPFSPSLRGQEWELLPFPFFSPPLRGQGSRPYHFPSGGESALLAQGTPQAQVLGWFCCILGHSQPGAMGDTLEFQGVLVPAHSPKVRVV